MKKSTITAIVVAALSANIAAARANEYNDGRIDQAEADIKFLKDDQGRQDFILDQHNERINDVTNKAWDNSERITDLHNAAIDANVKVFDLENQVNVNTGQIFNQQQKIDEIDATVGIQHDRIEEVKANVDRNEDAIRDTNSRIDDLEMTNVDISNLEDTVINHISEQVDFNGEISAQVDATAKDVVTVKGEQNQIKNDQAAIVKEQVAQSNQIKQETADRVAGQQEVLDKSVGYTDTKAGETLKAANDHANTKAAETLASANGYTDDRVAVERNERIEGNKQTLAEAKAHTNQKFKQLRNIVDQNKRQANAGISGALAASQIPQVSNGKNFSVGAGAGTYGGQSAIAVGFSSRLSEHTVTKLAVTADTAHSFGLGAGVSYEW